MTDNTQPPATLPLAPADADVKHFSPVEQKKIAEIKDLINVQDSVGVMQYGIAAQTQIADFSDRILSEVKVKDTGYVGNLLTDLMVNVKELDVDSLGDESFLANIPLIGNLVNSTKKFIARYQTLSVQIEKITTELDKARMLLAKDILMLDGLYDKNVEYFKELSLFIAAGEAKLKELRQTALPQLEARAAQTNDPMDAQQVKDLVQLLDRFDKRLHDLQLSRMVAFQTAPQIRIIQNNNQLLAEKIQSSILNTIPLWKSQMVIAISMLRQKKALELQRQVSETTDELLEKNMELLKESSTGVAREMEKGIVSIDTLKKVNADLIATIDETLKIQAEGREKRAQAEVELTKIEQELKDKLVSLK